MEKNCSRCAAWSELVAKFEGDGPVEALCLNPPSPNYSKYTTGDKTCIFWSDNPELADYPSQRAPNARDKSGRGETLGQIEARTGKSVLEQITEIFGKENVVELKAGEAVMIKPRSARTTPMDKWTTGGLGWTIGVTQADGRITKTLHKASMLSGKVREKSFTASADQWAALEAGTLIQKALPHLTPAEREFIQTGISDDEWQEAFPEDDEDPLTVPPRSAH